MADASAHAGRADVGPSGREPDGVDAHGSASPTAAAHGANGACKAPPLAASRTRQPPARGILRAPPPGSSSALWLGKELVYNLNSRLAQQNLPSLPVKVPNTGAVSMLTGVFRRWGSAAGATAEAPHEAPPADAPAPAHAGRRRHVHFRVEDLAHTYPIATADAPGAERATRDRIEEEYEMRMNRLLGRAWTPGELQGLYRMCCRAREQAPCGPILRALDQAASWPRGQHTLDFTSVDLRAHAQPLADMLGAPMALQRLVLEDCHLTDAGAAAILDALLTASSVRSLSLAGNVHVRAQGWDALGDLVAQGTLEHLDVSENSLAKSAVRALLGGGAHKLQTLRMEQCDLRPASLDIIAHAVHQSPLRHLSLRRNRIGGHGVEVLAAVLRDVPEDAAAAIEAAEHASPLASGTELYPPHGDAPVARALLEGTPVGLSDAHERLRAELMRGAAAFRSVLAPLPVCSALLTLDLKSNMVRGNVAPLAAALRRNRTLRVLSLSDNELDPLGLALLADALRYNTTLETLDVSHNPCCADMVGVLRLREALAVHPKLKRVFLANTQLTPEGAVALAECLPDARHLLHLDLAGNPLRLVGTLALHTGLTANASVRCLDVSVDTSDAEQLAAAQRIYDVCHANAEAAHARATTGTARHQAHQALERSVLAAALHKIQPPSTAHIDALDAARHALRPEAGESEQASARAALEHAVEHWPSADEKILRTSLDSPSGGAGGSPSAMRYQKSPYSFARDAQHLERTAQEPDRAARRGALDGGKQGLPAGQDPRGQRRTPLACAHVADARRRGQERRRTAPGDPRSDTHGRELSSACMYHIPALVDRLTLAWRQSRGRAPAPCTAQPTRARGAARAAQAAAQARRARRQRAWLGEQTERDVRCASWCTTNGASCAAHHWYSSASGAHSRWCAPAETSAGYA